MNQDQEHLKLLSVFHYVLAAMATLVFCIPLIHFFMGLAFATGMIGHNEPETATVGVFLMVFAGVFILTGWTFAVFVFFAGRNLGKKKCYTYCFFMACFECLFMPFGTVLGVFTIIVLMRESVKSLFQGGGSLLAPEQSSDTTG